MMQGGVDAVQCLWGSVGNLPPSRLLYLTYRKTY